MTKPPFAVLYGLALLGAALSAAGDALCVAAARGHSPRLCLALSVLAWAVCAPIWFEMARVTRGSFVEPAAAWSVCVCVFSVALALAAGDEQKPAQWIGFGLVLLGIAIRALGGLK